MAPEQGPVNRAFVKRITRYAKAPEAVTSSRRSAYKTATVNTDQNKCQNLQRKVEVLKKPHGEKKCLQKTKPHHKVRSVNNCERS